MNYTSATGMTSRAVRFVNRHSFPVFFQVCGRKDDSVPPGTSGTQPISEIVRADTDTTGIDFRFAWACLEADRLMVPPGGFQIEYRIYTGHRNDPNASLLPVNARRTNPFEVRWPDQVRG